jgi:hypothetical protein
LPCESFGLAGPSDDTDCFSSDQPVPVNKAPKTDPTNTDPYKYELCCAPEGTWDCNFALTDTCRWDFRFRCELDGTLTHKKESAACSLQCACFEWTEAEDKPPVNTHIPRAASKVNGADETKAKIIEAASPFDFVDYTRKVPRKEEGETLAGVSGLDTTKELHTEPAPESERDTISDPIPGVKSGEEDDEILSDLNQAPADDLSKADSLSKRHNYALVCELDGSRDVDVTRSCASGPRYYSCDGNGRLCKSAHDDYCDQHCACQNLTPARVFKAGSLKYSGGRMSKGLGVSGCSSCKRGKEPEKDE